MELARGTVSDRPWGQTLGALGTRGLSGQLTIVAEGKQYCIAFRRGAIVGATSPLATDAAVRIALTGGLVSSTQAADISRRIAAAPARDELDVIAEAIRLMPDQAQRLRRRVIAHRAARTFAVERGEFVVDDRVTIPVPQGSELDIRAVIYLGAKNNLGDERLARELAQIGAWFKLKPEAVPDLAQFGFTEVEKPVLQALIDGANVVDLEIGHSDLDSRGVRSIVYALASIGACEVSATTRGEAKRPSTPPPARTAVQSRTVTPPLGRTTTVTRTTPGSGVAVTPPRSHALSTAPTELRRAPSEGEPVPRRPATVSPPTEPRTRTPNSAPPPETPDGMRIRTPRTTERPSSDPGVAAAAPREASGSQPGIKRSNNSGSSPQLPRTSSEPRLPPMRAQTNPGAVRTPRKADGGAMSETEKLIAEKVPLLDSGADHYALLGIKRESGPDTVRNAYFELARKLHPDRLASLGIADANRDAQRLFAQINTAFAVLADPARSKDYLDTLARGGEAAVRAEENRADELAQRVMRAEEAFRRGEMALRRDQLSLAITEFTSASELQPNEPEYHALLAWSKFAAAQDKVAVADATRKALLKAADSSDKSVTARFYLGRVERMLGREREALTHFQMVLMIKPNHADANSEVRILEQRLKGKR